MKRFFAVFFSLILAFSLCSPALAADGDQGEGMVAAKAALLADPETGEILFARSIHEKLYPASLTKVMTALLVLEAVERGELALSDQLTASEAAIASLPADGSNAGIKAGESLSVELLLNCILVVSANEACDILAEGVAGSREAFVALMNQRAAELGCENTHFVNTSGLQNSEHYSTAWDLYLITQEARKNDIFRSICATKYFELPASEFSRARTFHTTNYLISTARNAGYLYSGADGVKTGSTSDAGYCLIASAKRGERSLLFVILGAQRVTLADGGKDTQSFSEAVRFLDWGFDSFSRQVILRDDELLAEVPVTLSQQQNAVKVHPAQEIERLIPTSIDPAADIQRELVFSSESVEAPVTAGQVLGQITLRHGDTVYATVDLLADEDVSASPILVFRRDALAFLHRPIVKFSAIGALALVVILVIAVNLAKHKKRRYGRSSFGPGAGGYRGRRR